MQPDEEHFRKLERMYHGAPVNRYYQPTIRIASGSAELDLPVKLDFFHAAHAVHGSVYFEALDDAAFFAVSSLVTDVFVLTASYNIYLTRPVTQGILRASGRAFDGAALPRLGDTAYWRNRKLRPNSPRLPSASIWGLRGPTM
jgi:acyl-coenzyme A thioesterase PaaI-like protein